MHDVMVIQQQEQQQQPQSFHSSFAAAHFFVYGLFALAAGTVDKRMKKTPTELISKSIERL